MRQRRPNRDVHSQRHFIRRLVIATAACLAVYPIVAQVPAPGIEFPTPEPGVNHLMRLPSDPLAISEVSKAQAAIEQGRSTEGLEALQVLLEQESDFFLHVDQKISGSLMGRIEQTLLQNRDDYQRLYGPTAGQMLEEARRDQNASQLEDLVRRFRLTDAGAEGLRDLSRFAEDRGEPGAAARLLELLALHPATTDRRAPLTAAARLLRQSGQSDRAIALLKRHPDLGVTLDGIPAAPGKILSAAEAPLYEWWAPYGGRQHAGQATFAPAAFDDAWAQPLIQDYDFDALFPETELITRLVQENRDLAEAIEKRVRSYSGRVTFPAVRPLIVNNLLITNGGGSVKALNLETGKLQWNGVIVDQTFSFLTKGSYSPQEGKDPLREDLRTLFTSVRDWRDLTASSMSTDGTQVYAITDCQLVGSSPPQRMMQNTPRNTLLPQRSNRLHAFDLATDGMLRWSIGTYSQDSSPYDSLGEPPREIFFLGAPLPVDGRLYALGEERGQIQLLEIDAGTGAVLWSVGLLNPDRDLLLDTQRRLAGLMPAYADGLLICPTGEGVLTAVDPLQRKVVWSHAYSDAAPMGRRQQLMMMQMMRPSQENVDQSIRELLDDQRWLDSRVIVDGEYVVYTPPDENVLVCVRVDDGRPVWSKPFPRLQMLYAGGVYDGCVILVGRSEVQAFRLADGEPAWQAPVPLPEPSGRGLRMGNQFLQPLTTGEIAVIDLPTARLLTRLPLMSGKIAGNLAAGEGVLISQSGGTATGFRSRSQIETELADRFKISPDDPAGLALQGEMKLQQGDLTGAISELRKGLQQTDLLRAQRILSWTLLEGLRTDFAGYRDLVPELERLPLDPEQRMAFLRAQARGLQQSGERSEALLVYLKILTELPLAQPVHDRDSRWATTDSRWALARIGEIFSNASEEEQRTLQGALKTWVADPQSQELTLRLLPAIPEDWLLPDARLTVLEQRRLEDRELLQREAVLAPLLSSTDSRIRARAAALLTDLSLHVGDEDGASRAFAILEAEDPALQLSATETLADRLSTLRENSKVAELRKQVPRWPEYLHIDEETVSQSTPTTFQIPLLGGASAPLQGWTFFVGDSGAEVYVIDAHGRQSKNLQTRLQPGRYPGSPVSRYVSVNNHIALIVLMDRFLVVDLLTDSDSPRRIINRTLVAEKDNGNVNRIYGGQQTMAGLRSIRVGAAGGAPYGNVGPLTSSLLCYTCGDELIALDPLSGEELWRRRDIPVGAEVLGDEHIVLVKPPEGDSLLMFRGSDGEAIGTSHLPAGTLTSLERRGGDWGRCVPVIRRVEESLEWSLIDLPTGDAVWKHTMPAGTCWTCVNGRQVAFLTPSYELTIFDPVTDSELLRLNLPEQDPCGQLAVLEFPEQWIVLTATGRMGDRRGLYRLSAEELVTARANGSVMAIDRRTNAISWQRNVKEQRVMTQPPGAWPVLIFASARPRTLDALILNRRTGEEIYQLISPDNEGGINWSGEVDPYQIQLQIGRDRVSIRCDDSPEATPRKGVPLPPQSEEPLEPKIDE